MLDVWRRCKNPGDQADAKLNQCLLLHDLLVALEDVAWLDAIDVADPKVYTLRGATEEVVGNETCYDDAYSSSAMPD